MQIELKALGLEFVADVSYMAPIAAVHGATMEDSEPEDGGDLDITRVLYISWDYGRRTEVDVTFLLKSPVAREAIYTGALEALETKEEEYYE